MDILDLLVNGDPMAQQARQAAALQNKKQFQQTISDSTDQANRLNTLAFVAQNSNNPVLAKSVAALQQNQQSQFAPQKLDKGVYIPNSGDYLESPGVQEEKDADRENRRLLAAGQVQSRQESAGAAADARRYAADQSRDARVLTATLAAQGRGQMTAAQQANEDIRRERLANQISQQNQNDVTKFGGTLTKNGIPQIADAVGDINTMLKSDKPLEGIGYGQETLSKIPVLSDLTMGAEGKNNRAKVQKLINAITLTEAGKAVTKNELVRQALVNMASDNYSEADFRNAMKTVVLPALENVRSNVLKSTDPSIVDQYLKNDSSGFNPRTSFLGGGVLPGGSVTPPTVDAAPIVNRPSAEMHFDAQGKRVR